MGDKRKTVLVCGGRGYRDFKWVLEVLDKVKEEVGDFLLIEGGAPGADRMARGWAKTRGVEFKTYAADWEKYGRAAGPKRNEQMMEEGKPDLVVAFPGFKGTKDAMKRARDRGIEVREIAARVL